MAGEQVKKLFSSISNYAVSNLSHNKSPLHT